jgi:acyl carrier protein
MSDSIVLEDKVKAIVKKILEINDEINISDDLTNIGLDSLKTVMMVIDLEVSFQIVIEDEELLFENFTNIEKILRLVESKIDT